MKKVKMSDAERIALKNGKLKYRQSLQNPIRHRTNRDEILRAFVDCKLPNWGGLKFIIK